MATLRITGRLSAATAGYAGLWLVAVADWMWSGLLPVGVSWIVFSLSFPLGAVWLWRVTRPPRDAVRICIALSVVYVLWWQLLVFAADALVLDVARTHIARIGTGGLFMIGLCWVVWGLERTSRFYEALRRRQVSGVRGQGSGESPPSVSLTPVTCHLSSKNWNPLDTSAWYYGRSRRLNQSLAGFTSYSVLFLLAFLVLTHLGGCQELYEMPAGGGEQKTLAQQVKVQKIIRKKFVINPFSAIKFLVPPIDEIKLQLTEITKHAYTVGYGQGTGAGFAGGTKRGKVRFIRLEYPGGDWNQDFGVGADMNMLIEYGVRTQHPVANRTESRTVAELDNFPTGKSPPFVFMTGQRDISFSNSEIKAMREYLTDKHGMLFCDNGGSAHFHRQFLGLMGRVLPNVRPVPVPLDDVIHRIPYQIPFLPYVAPHGGNQALGWKLEGRWVAYYHPGDVADAWADDHAGVQPEIWEACYQLGTNVIFYAHTEYSKWLEARQR